MLDLKQLLVETKSAWIDFPGIEGFKVEVAMLSRPELIKLRKGCTISKFDKKSRSIVEELDEEKFVNKFTNVTVKDWAGLKLEDVQSLALIDFGDNDPEARLEYSQANAEVLVSNSSEFDTWLNEVVFDLDNFRS